MGLTPKKALAIALVVVATIMIVLRIPQLKGIVFGS